MSVLTPPFVIPGPAALALLGVFLLPPTAAAQQSAVVDEGTFTITRNGAPVGREAFRIVRAAAPGGQVFRASGTTVIGDSRLQPTLGTDSLGMPVSYECTVLEKGAVVQRLRGSGRPGRFGIVSSLASGNESAKEFVLTNGALLLDQGVFHHFYFIPLLISHTRATVIVPRSGGQEQFTIADHGAEPVELAGTRVPGRRYSITGERGGRDVWVDQRGRLLKVSIPEQGLVALRDDPPR
jgi:hypothetical protein